MPRFLGTSEELHNNHAAQRGTCKAYVASFRATRACIDSAPRFAAHEAARDPYAFPPRFAVDASASEPFVYPGFAGYEREKPYEIPIESILDPFCKRFVEEMEKETIKRYQKEQPEVIVLASIDGYPISATVTAVNYDPSEPVPAPTGPFSFVLTNMPANPLPHNPFAITGIMTTLNAGATFDSSAPAAFSAHAPATMPFSTPAALPAEAPFAVPFSSSANRETENAAQLACDVADTPSDVTDAPPFTAADLASHPVGFPAPVIIDIVSDGDSAGNETEQRGTPWFQCSSHTQPKKTTASDENRDYYDLSANLGPYAGVESYPWLFADANALVDGISALYDAINGAVDALTNALIKAPLDGAAASVIFSAKFINNYILGVASLFFPRDPYRAERQQVSIDVIEGLLWVITFSERLSAAMAQAGRAKTPYERGAATANLGLNAIAVFAPELQAVLPTASGLLATSKIPRALITAEAGATRIAKAVKAGEAVARVETRAGVPSASASHVPTGQAFRIDLPKHLAGPDGFKQGKLYGTHNLEIAIAEMKSKGYKHTVEPTKTPGILELKYERANAKGRGVEESKTVYDLQSILIW